MMARERFWMAGATALLAGFAVLAWADGANVSGAIGRGRQSAPPGAGDEKPQIGSLQRRVPPDDTTVVPNVVGMVWKKAIPVIQAAGLYATSNEPLSKSKDKVVASQSPAAGTRVAKKTFVTATVR